MKNLDTIAQIKDSSLYSDQNSATFQSKNYLQKSTTVEFFKTLYNYPPSFRLKLNNPQQVNYKNTTVGNKIKKGTISKKFDRTEKYTYSLPNYADGFKNKIVTSNKFQTNDFTPQYFNSVPVYVILNGSGEIILGKTMLNNSNQLTKSTGLSINGKIYDLCGAFEDNNLTRESHLGLFFLNKKDAEICMKELLLKDNNGVDIQGISIHCTNLVSAYNLMCEHHPGFDFRFVPDMQEVISLLEINDYTRNTMSVVNSSNKPLDHILEKIDRLEDPITNLYWDHSSNELPAKFSSQAYYNAWSGVPTYLINEPKTKTTYVFLNYLKAKKFVDLRSDSIESMNKGYEFETLPIFKDFSIQVTSLENLLEFWSTIENSTKSDTKFVFYNSEDQKEIPFRIPLYKQYQEAILRKYRVVSSYWSAMLYS